MIQKNVKDQTTKQIIENDFIFIEKTKAQEISKLLKITLDDSKTKLFHFGKNEKAQEILKYICTDLGMQKEEITKQILVLKTPQITWPLEEHEEPLKLVNFKDLNSETVITFRKREPKEQILVKLQNSGQKEHTPTQFLLDYDDTVSDFICLVVQKQSAELNKFVVQCQTRKKNALTLQNSEKLIDILRENIFDKEFKLLLIQNKDLNSLDDDNSSEIILKIKKKKKKKKKKKNKKKKKKKKELDQGGNLQSKITSEENEIANIQQTKINQENQGEDIQTKTPVEKKKKKKKKKKKQSKQGNVKDQGDQTFSKKKKNKKKKKKKKRNKNKKNINNIETETSITNISTNGTKHPNKLKKQNSINSLNNDSSENLSASSSLDSKVESNLNINNDPLQQKKVHSELKNTNNCQKNVNKKRINNKENNYNFLETFEVIEMNHIVNGSSNDKEKLNTKKVDYNFPAKYQFNTNKVEFHIFNRNIMDYIVESNTKYLKNEGFFMETQGQLEKIQKNLGILEIIKLEMEDKGQYSYENLSEIEKLLLKKVKGIDSNTRSEALTLVKDLKSMRQFLLDKDKGVLDLIKQDLGVYWFNSNNELEMTSGRTPTSTTFGVKFSGKPLKSETIDSKTGLVSRKAPTYFTLTQNFLYYFKLERNKPQYLEEKLKKRQLERSIPLGGLNISRGLGVNNLLSQEKELYSFRILYGTNHIDVFPNSELKKENWARMIGLMKSRLQIQKLIRVNSVSEKYPWSYAVIFHGSILEEGTYSFDVRCLNSMWNIKKTFQDFYEFREKLSTHFPTIIFPTVRKKLVKKEAKTESKIKKGQNKNEESSLNLLLNDRQHEAEMFIDAFMKEILSDLEVSQSKDVRSFLEIDEIFHPLSMEDLELTKMIFKLDKNAAMKLNKDGDNLLHFAIKNKCKDEIINLILHYFHFFYKLPNRNQLTPILLAIQLGKLNVFKLFSQYNVIDLNIKHPRLQNINSFLYAAKKSQFDILKFIFNDYEKNQHLDVQKKNNNNIINNNNNNNNNNNGGGGGDDDDEVEQEKRNGNGKEDESETSYNKEKLNINLQETQSKNSALHFAVLKENIEMIKYLIQIGINTELKNSFSLTPLNIAIKKENFEIVELLLNNNSDPNSTDSQGKTSLHICSETGNDKILEILLKNSKCKINQVDNFHRTALFDAIKANSMKCIKLLIKNTIKINQYDTNNLNAIHYALQMENDEIIKYFYHNVDPQDIELSQPTKLGIYPLHTAARSKKIIFIGFVLKFKNIDINSKDNEGNTALHIATINEDLNSIRYLLKKGANPLIQNNNRSFPFFLASKIVDYRTATEIILTLINKNSKLDSRNGPFQRTLLHEVVINKNIKLARFLIDMDANLNLQDLSGNSALHVLFFNKNKHPNLNCDLYLALYMIQRGADPYIGNNRSKTPLDLYGSGKGKKKMKEKRKQFQNRIKNMEKGNGKSISVIKPIKKSLPSIKINYFDRGSINTIELSKKFISIFELKQYIAREFDIKSLGNVHFVLKDSDNQKRTRITNHMDINIIYSQDCVVNAFQTEDWEKLFQFNFFEN
ncbi:ankyrin repeat family protein [Anaeramoeba flamelloides]|uniref:Ankyrin repeat family protein n=1 Tax=Anaeramoeba flamelloides TaxID=1746091 RepID=A0ABQ8X949_9EUKA|nr:ankyrin repeat family protein [Anaeramoeba flamelloides]